MSDFRGLWFKGDDDPEWKLVQLHAIDAAHALEVDPEHWKTEKPEEMPVEEDEINEDEDQ